MCLPVHPTNMTEHEMRHEQLLKQGITINVPPIGTTLIFWIVIF